MSHILIVEDEERISSFLEKGLGREGYATTVVRDGDEAITFARHGHIDLMILDLGLPGKDGLSVLLTVRQHDPDLPVIILTARDSVEDTVAGLDSGADDYMPKPFKFQELLARVRARLRAPGSDATFNLRAGDAELDLRARTVRVGEGKDMELTAREFALAETLFRHAGQILSREQLLSAVWGLDHEPGTNVVEVYIGYLRRKLDDGRITTIRGMGYRLETHP